MTDYAKLESELRDCANTAYVSHCPAETVATIRRAADALAQAVRERDEALQAMSAPVDAEREKLAKWCETERERYVGPEKTAKDPSWKMHCRNKMRAFERIAQLLRRPVAPVVTEKPSDDVILFVAKALVPLMGDLPNIAWDHAGARGEQNHYLNLARRAYVAVKAALSQPAGGGK